MLLLASALLILSLTQRTLAQSTASLFIPSFGDVNLQGAEVGVGTDGTTFVLSGSFTTDSFVSPLTMTLVEGASQVVEIAAVRTGSGQNDVVGIGVDCELSGPGKEANCVQVFTFAGLDKATTLQGSILVQPTAVPIIDAQTGSAPGPSGSGNGSGETSSTSGHGPAATSMLTQTAPVIATTTQISVPPAPMKSSAVARRHSLVQSVAMMAPILLLLYTCI